MKTGLNLLLLLCCWVAASSAEQPAIDPSLTTEDRTIGGDPTQRYFVIRHQIPSTETPKEYGLLLVLPGGPGNADFLPFCANVITLAGTPKDFIVAELVAPVWGKLDNSTIVWPGAAFPDKNARFTSEQFLDAVIADVSRLYKIHEGWVFTLGWSSSGHILYNSSFENSKIRGAFVAMSRFQPAWFAHPENAKGKRYYFWHSPEDSICPFAETESAASFLTEQGAATIVRSYRGGHGWVTFTFYGDRIKEALEWFRASEADAPNLQQKINAAGARQ